MRLHMLWMRNMHNTNDRCRSFTLNQKRCGETALENMQGGLQTVWFMQHLRLGSWVRNYAYSHSAFFLCLPCVCVCLLLAHATKSGCFSTLLKKERVKTWSETQQGSLSASASAFPFALACCSFRFGFAFAFGLRRSFGLGVNGLLVHNFFGLSFLG